jgi:hypothetical protein
MEDQEGRRADNGIDTQAAHPNDPCFLDEDDPYFFSASGLYAVYNCVDSDGNDYLKYVPVIT